MQERSALGKDRKAKGASYSPSCKRYVDECNQLNEARVLDAYQYVIVR
jgi:hypothetical protein